METPDRLAAYLAGELDSADRDALDDELARDGQLRAALAAMRRADDALDGLRSPTPDDGFDARMDAFVDGFLAELDAADERVPAAEPADATTDTESLDATARSRSGWTLAIAAALILLAGVGVATLQPFGGDDTATGGAELSALDETERDEATAESAQDATEEAGPIAVPMQPLIRDEQRTLDDDQLDALLDEPVLTDVAGAGLDRDRGTDVGLELQRQLGQPGPEADVPTEDAPESDADVADDGDAAADTESADPEPALPRPDDGLITRTGEPVDERLLADAQRCLGTLLEAGPTAIPVYVEFAMVGQQQAVVFGLVTIDPQDDGFTRREVWTLDRTTCQVLRFAQS